MFGFDFMFTFVPIIIGIGFMAVTGFIIGVIVKGTVQWNKNNNSPLLKVEARVTAKRMAVGGGFDNMPESSSYYVTFEVESGDRMEFSVTGKEYGMIAEGDFGMLTFQGTRYKGFERF